MLNKNLGFALVMLLMVLAIAAVSYSQASADPAIVIHAQEGCTVEDLDHNFVPPDSPPRGNGVIIVTENPNGNWSALCTGRLPEGSRLPDRPVVWTYEDVGGWCGIPGWIVTTNFVQVITPSGQVSLTCHFPESPMPQGQVASFGLMP